MTKYSLLDNGDIVGPFSVSELVSRAGFGPHSLVCPSDHAAEGSYWKEAYLYEEFNFQEEMLVEEAAETLLTVPLDQLKQEEIEKADAVLANEKSKNALAAAQAEKNKDSSSAALQKPSLLVEEKTVFQDNPIEEYFNTMREGDLGNILGIPDKTNSDLDLARVLEKQFSKTDPQLPSTAPAAQAEQKDPFDEFTNTAPNTQKEEEKVSEKEETASEALDLQTAVSLSVKEPEPDKPSKAVEPLSAMMENTERKPAQPVKNTASDTTPIDLAAQPVAQIVGSRKEPASIALSAPKSNKRSKIMDRIRRFSLRQYVFVGALLVVSLLVVGALLSVWSYSRHKKTPANNPAPAQQVAEPMPENQPLTQAVPTVNAPVKTPTEELAQEIVKRHVLDEQRGSIENYLAKKYATELASGYTAMWAAEPLHSNSYVVRYRLVKARKEPIVYVFQVDTAKKKLTGALNNITLDLVGKINS